MMCIKLVMSKLSRSSKSYFANAKVKRMVCCVHFIAQCGLKTRVVQ